MNLEGLEDGEIIEELNDKEYGDHPPSIVITTLEEGPPEDYPNKAGLLTDLSNVEDSLSNTVDVQSDREEAEDFVQEYCSELELSEEASLLGTNIVEYLDEETYENHNPNAIAGASTHISSKLVNEAVLQKDVADAASISTHYLRDAYADVEEQIVDDSGTLRPDFADWKYLKS